MGLSALRMRALGVGACAALLAGCEGVRPDAVGVPPGADSVVSDDSVVPDELIVSVTPGADRDDLETLYAGLGVTLRDRLTRLSVDLLGVDPTQRDDVRDSLEDSPLVEGVADNQLYGAEVTPNDPRYPAQWHLSAIEAPAAWATTTGSEQILVAVLDTGVDLNHADLASKLRSGGNTVDGAAGWQDMHGHGTAVAGIIGAAADNAEGAASVAWSSPLMPIKVTADDGRATTWSVAAGIALAVSAGAKVISVSFSPVHDNAILLRQARLAQLSGALVVFAAGNSGQEVFGGGSDSAVFVGAVDRGGSLTGTSTFGEFVDLVAPGVSIYATHLGNTYGTATGTSFAAPIVSGVAALVWSANPGLGSTTVQAILLTTATDLGPDGDDARFGAGQVNARAAVELAQVIVEQPDQTPPAVSIVQPADGAGVSGPTSVQVQVSDDNDVADVTLSVDGVALASDAVFPYAFVLDTTKYAIGRHTVAAVATDVFGNPADHQISLVFAGAADEVPPSVRIVSPTGGSGLRGTVTIVVHASDDRALAQAEVLVDNQVIETIPISGAEARIAYNWDASAANVDAGPHTISVRVVDTSGNANFTTVGVTVGQ